MPYICMMVVLLFDDNVLFTYQCYTKMRYSYFPPMCIKMWKNVSVSVFLYNKHACTTHSHPIRLGLGPLIVCYGCWLCLFVCLSVMSALHPRPFSLTHPCQATTSTLSITIVLCLSIVLLNERCLYTILPPSLNT